MKTPSSSSCPAGRCQHVGEGRQHQRRRRHTELGRTSADGHPLGRSQLVGEARTVCPSAVTVDVLAVWSRRRADPGRAVGRVAQKSDPVVQIPRAPGVVDIGGHGKDPVARGEPRLGKRGRRLLIDSGPLGQQQRDSVAVGDDAVQVDVHDPSATGQQADLDRERRPLSRVATPVAQPGARRLNLTHGGVQREPAQVMHRHCPQWRVESDALYAVRAHLGTKHVMLGDESPPPGLETVRVNAVKGELLILMTANRVVRQLG